MTDGIYYVAIATVIFSHVKITCYLHMWKYHRCYGYIINSVFHTKKLLKWNGFVFHWCLYNKEEKFRISARPCNILYLSCLVGYFFLCTNNFQLLGWPATRVRGAATVKWKMKPNFQITVCQWNYKKRMVHFGGESLFQWSRQWFYPQGEKLELNTY